jgi:hypothetical protein
MDGNLRQTCKQHLLSGIVSPLVDFVTMVLDEESAWLPSPRPLELV